MLDCISREVEFKRLGQNEESPHEEDQSWVFFNHVRPLYLIVLEQRLDGSLDTAEANISLYDVACVTSDHAQEALVEFMVVSWLLLDYFGEDYQQVVESVKLVLFLHLALHQLIQENDGGCH